MKKKKTWRLIGTGFDLDNNIICDIICEETQLVKSVIIKQNIVTAKMNRVNGNNIHFIPQMMLFPMVMVKNQL